MEYIALGCMTGTSLDGIDCSLIKSDGISEVKKFQIISLLILSIEKRTS
jgi:1,6-anhydro-N-acetylmuramate kinase